MTVPNTTLPSGSMRYIVGIQLTWYSESTVVSFFHFFSSEE